MAAIVRQDALLQRSALSHHILRCNGVRKRRVWEAHGGEVGGVHSLPHTMDNWQQAVCIAPGARVQFLGRCPKGAHTNTTSTQP